MKILDLVDDVRSGCKSVLTTMTLEEYKKLSFFAFNNNGNIDGQRSVIKRSSTAAKIRKRMADDFRKGAIFPQVVLGVLFSTENMQNLDESKFYMLLERVNEGQISIIDGMQRSNILKLHINEAMRRDERINALAILKIAGMPLIHKMYILLFNESEGDNELERINNWIYDKRCSIAHFRYGQQKNEETYVNEEILEMMLELLVGIFSNINQNMKDICSGLVKLEESTLA